jgi:cell division inhibitor SepF
MAGFFSKLQKMWNPPDDEYEDYDSEEYEDEPEEEEEEPQYNKRSSKNTNEDQSSPSLFKRNSRLVSMNGQQAQLHVVVFKPMSFGEDTKEIADSLIRKNAVVLNLERTPKEESRRILDFLSGVAYANNGKIQKIATSTYIITPYNVDLSGDDLFDEFENNGVYF